MAKIGRKATKILKAQTQPPQEIEMFIHCEECALEWKADKSINTKFTPRDYARFSIGWTKKGLQVWCIRHDLNVLHLDFLGQKVSKV